MRMKVLISLILIAAMAFGIGAGSYAWFTSSATSTNNVFATGTLELDGIEDEIFTEGVLDVDNIYPSWSSYKDITVINNGTLDFMYRLTSIDLEASSAKHGIDQDILYSGKNGLEVSFDGNNWMKVNDAKNVYLGVIPAEENNNQRTFRIHYRLPWQANDDYQGATATLKFNFLATQLENEEWVVNE